MVTAFSECPRGFQRSRRPAPRSSAIAQRRRFRLIRILKREALGRFVDAVDIHCPRVFTILTLWRQRDELPQVIVIERALAKIASGGLTQVPQQVVVKRWYSKRAVCVGAAGFGHRALTRVGKATGQTPGAMSPKIRLAL